MGIPWNPEWDERIRQIAQQVAARHLENALADGSTLSQMTPASVPSIASTNAVTSMVVNTDALAVQTQLSGLTGEWAPLNPVVEMTVTSGGRPVWLLFCGPVRSPAEECRLSFSIDGVEVTRTAFGLAIFSTNAWKSVAMSWLIQSPRPRFRVAVVGRRDAVTGSANVGSYVTRSTLTAVEV